MDTTQCDTTYCPTNQISLDHGSSVLRILGTSWVAHGARALARAPPHAVHEYNSHNGLTPKTSLCLTEHSRPTPIHRPLNLFSSLKTCWKSVRSSRTWKPRNRKAPRPVFEFALGRLTAAKADRTSEPAGWEFLTRMQTSPTGILWKMQPLYAAPSS